MKSVSFVTGARDGDARAPGQLARLLRKRKFPVTFAAGKQVHGNAVHLIPRLNRARIIPRIDGLLTDASQQPLVIFTADCVPVFLEAGDARVIGMLHAGWRGVHHRILARAVAKIRQKWHIPPSSIRAWSGPHIGSCCFEVQWDVAKHFPRTRKRFGQRWKVDLEGELRAQARQIGLKWVAKKGFRGCTMHEVQYHSYRRNQTPKRQVSVIMKQENA